MLGDKEGHIIIGLNKLHKVILLKPTPEGPYQNVDELNYDMQNLGQPMNVKQIQAVGNVWEVTHRHERRKEYEEMFDKLQSEMEK